MLKSKNTTPVHQPALLSIPSEPVITLADTLTELAQYSKLIVIHTDIHDVRKVCACMPFPSGLYPDDDWAYLELFHQQGLDGPFEIDEWRTSALHITLLNAIGAQGWRYQLELLVNGQTSARILFPPGVPATTSSVTAEAESAVHALALASVMARKAVYRD